MKQSQLFRKLVTMLLCVAMLLSLLPTYALATEADEEGSAVSEETQAVASVETEQADDTDEDAAIADSSASADLDTAEEEAISAAADAAILTTGTRPDAGTTEGQPFASGTGGSTNFRIPAITCLDDGTIVAATDARWNTSADGGGLDTIVSYSTDNGATWNYSFANYLGDNGNTHNTASTCFIDPSLATDGKNVYMVVDLFPAGYALNGATSQPTKGDIGFTADGYLKLSGDSRSSYGYYLKDGVIYTTDGTAVDGYTVDGYFNIKSEDGSVDTNLFCADSPYLVYPTDYLYFTKSADGGKTWSEPTLINVKKSTEQVYIVGPGNAIVLDDGTIMFPGYNYTSGFQVSSMFYSTDGGATWSRTEDATPGATSGSNWSSEATPVQIDENTVRLFYRDANSVLYYTDYTRQGDEWVPGEKTATTATKTTNNQLSAIRYSLDIDGQPAILVSTAASGSSSRTTGKIYTFLINDDNSLTLKYTYSVNGTSYYAYSSLTELEDGSIGLLYESAGASETFVKLPIETITSDDAVIGNNPRIRVSAEETTLLVCESTTVTAKVFNAEDAEVTWTSSNTDVATVSADGKVVAHGAGTADIIATITVDDVDYTNEVTVQVYTQADLPLPSDYTGEVIAPADLSEHQYQLDVNGINDGDAYVIYHNYSARILYNAAGGTCSDQVGGSVSGDILTTNTSSTKWNDDNQTWIFTAVEGGYTIKGVASDSYINLNKVTTTSSGSRVPLSSEPQTLTVEDAGDGNYIISGTVDGTTYYLYHENAYTQWYVTTTATQVQLYHKGEGVYLVEDEALKTLIAQAETLSNEDSIYNAQNWSKFETALTAAKAVAVEESYETEEAATAAQTAINTAARDLYAAIKALTGEHTFNGVVTTAPTCVATGVMTYTCQYCGISYTEEIPATGEHTYKSEVTTAPTCGATGIMTYTCEVCGESYTEVIPATGEHSYKSEVTTAPTCGATGVLTYTCEVCGDVYTEVIPATGEHSYKSEVTTAPTCVATGIMTYTCEVCGDVYTEEIPATGEHSYKGEVTTEPTCGATGVKTYTCEVCGDTYTEEIPATGEHSYNGVVTTEPTCTETGVKTYTCEVCGDTYTEEIPATGHTVVVDEAQDPTSTETGLTEGKHCSVCQTVLVAQEVIPAVEEPATPSEQPTTPSTSTTVVVSSTTQEKTSPQTGDNAKIGYALGLLLLSGTALAAGLVLSARRKKH